MEQNIIAIVAGNLKKIRTYHGLTQRQIANYLHITRQCYTNYENGSRQISVSALTLLSDYYHIPLDNFRAADMALPPVLSENPPLFHINSADSNSSILRYENLSEKESKLIHLFSQLSETEQNNLLVSLKEKIHSHQD